MASFPITVFAPTNKSAGQTIQHAHVNDLQDEIVAIEDGYRNATAPINSSNSTLANLSVPGGSTFAARPVMPPPNVARVGLDADLEVGSGSTAAVNWTADQILTNSSMHSTGVTPERLTAQSTGVYVCMATIAWNAAGSTDYLLSLEDSSGTVVGVARYQGSSGRKYMTCYGVKRYDNVANSPWVRLVVRVDGSTNSIDRTQSYFSVHKL